MVSVLKSDKNSYASLNENKPPLSLLENIIKTPKFNLFGIFPTSDSASNKPSCACLFKRKQASTFFKSIFARNNLSLFSMLPDTNNPRKVLPPFAAVRELDASILDPYTGLHYDPDFCKKEKCMANCYLYAINSQTYPRGKYSWSWNLLAHEVLPYSKQNLIKSIVKEAEADGLTYAGARKPEMKECDGYLIAFYIKDPFINPPLSSSWDYHFVRQDKRLLENIESWSNKGSWDYPVTDRDDNNRKIIHPEWAKMRNYKFVGYFIAPKGGLRSSD